MIPRAALLFGHDISDWDFWKRRGFTDEDMDYISQYSQELPWGEGASRQAVDPSGRIQPFQGYDIDQLFAGKFSPETDPERMRGLLEGYVQSLWGDEPPWWGSNVKGSQR